MAVSYQQQALVRKVVYMGLIVALFTVSWLHRRLVVKEQARKLLLLEVSKGEVKLTQRSKTVCHDFTQAKATFR